MGGYTLQQNLYSRLSKNDVFLLFLFYVSSKFCGFENANFIALATQTLLQGLFLFLIPPINTYLSFFIFPLSF